MYAASIVYKSKRTGKTYITFCMLPSGPEHNEYFVKQICFSKNWEYISSQAEDNPHRHLTAKEKTLGLIRKPAEFLNKGEPYEDSL